MIHNVQKQIFKMGCVQLRYVGGVSHAAWASVTHQDWPGGP